MIQSRNSGETGGDVACATLRTSQGFNSAFTYVKEAHEANTIHYLLGKTLSG